MRLIVNGHPYEVDDGGPGTLLGWLRSVPGLTGAKPGCGEGACGACTVLVDGEPVLACQMPVAAATRTSVMTIEGLAVDGSLHPAQQALLEEQAMQCGYCIPGVALRIAALLNRHPDPESEQIVSALQPSLCRCGCYPSIVRAVHTAAELARSAGVLHSGAASRPRPRDVPPVRRPWDLSAPEDRTYFETLGPGLMFVCLPPAPAPGLWPAAGGVWMHLAGDGEVTAFSGKVDVGQGNATALRILVAEELDADLARVRLVQGDTDVCPFDMGTFGSRSLPDSGEPLRRVAAAARQYLVGEGARRWGIPAERIDTSGGGIDGPAGQRLDYAELAAGQQQLVIISQDPPLRPVQERRIVGRGGQAPSRPEMVTGALCFGSDRRVAGMLHAAVVRPPAVGAVLDSLDTSAAEQIAGVEVVWVGDVVAALADSPLKARAAVGAIHAKWRQPEPIHGDIATFLRSHPTPGEGWERAVDESDGDVDRVLASAPARFEGTYTTAFLAHVPLETSSALAVWGPDGRVTCEVGTQTPFRARSRVAEVCQVEEAEVRIVVPPTGGAFGGKHGGDIAAEAALLARQVGRPVQVHWSRAEEFTAGYLRPMAVIDIRAALAVDGSIAAWDHRVFNAGSAGLAPPYRTVARRLRSQPALSPVRQGSYRALGATANNFARESVVDELACLVGADPLEFRLRHLDDERLAEVLRRVAAHFGWSAPLPAGADHIGRGLAVGLEKGGRVATCAEVTVDPAGRVRPARILTAYECGTIVDPDTVRNQIEGGTVMALGGALHESVPTESGRPSLECLSAYPVPRIGDLPEIEVLLVDRPDQPSAGAGETPMIAVAPAIANAIFAATGQRRRHLPLDPT